MNRTYNPLQSQLPPPPPPPYGWVSQHPPLVFFPSQQQQPQRQQQFTNALCHSAVALPVPFSQPQYKDPVVVLPVALSSVMPCPPPPPPPPSLFAAVPAFSGIAPLASQFPHTVHACGGSCGPLLEASQQQPPLALATYLCHAPLTHATTFAPSATIFAAPQYQMPVMFAHPTAAASSHWSVNLDTDNGYSAQQHHRQQQQQPWSHRFALERDEKGMQRQPRSCSGGGNSRSPSLGTSLASAAILLPDTTVAPSCVEASRNSRSLCSPRNHGGGALHLGDSSHLGRSTGTSVASSATERAISPSYHAVNQSFAESYVVDSGVGEECEFDLGVQSLTSFGAPVLTGARRPPAYHSTTAMSTSVPEASLPGVLDEEDTKRYGTVTATRFAVDMMMKNKLAQNGGLREGDGAAVT